MLIVVCLIEIKTDKILDLSLYFSVSLPLYGSKNYLLVCSETF